MSYDVKISNYLGPPSHLHMDGATPMAVEWKVVAAAAAHSGPEDHSWRRKLGACFELQSLQIVVDSTSFAEQSIGRVARQVRALIRVTGGRTMPRLLAVDTGLLTLCVAAAAARTSGVAERT